MQNNLLRVALVAGVLFLSACAQSGAKGFPAGVDLAQYHAHGYPIPTSFPVPGYPESVGVDYWGGGNSQYMTYASMATPVQVIQWYESFYRSKGAKFSQAGADANLSAQQTSFKYGNSQINITATHYSDMAVTLIYVSYNTD